MHLLSMSCRSAAAPLVLLLLLMVAPSAPQVLPLQCEVSALPGGLFQYQLRTKPGLDSAPLPLDCTQRGWEDANKTVLTRDSVVDPKLVQSVADWALELKECLEFAHFTADCSASGFVEAICRTNCTSVPELSQADPPTVDPSPRGSQKSCGSVCVALIAAAVAVLVVSGLVAAGLMFLLKRRKERYIQARTREANPGDGENPAGIMLA